MKGDSIMTIVEKYKGKVIKKVSNTGIPKEEYNALLNQIEELTEELNNAGGLKVNLVSELPEVGEENQMYIISDNPNENILITADRKPTFDGVVVSVTNDTTCPNITVSKNRTTESFNIFLVSKGINPKPIMPYYTMNNGSWVKNMAPFVLFNNGSCHNSDIIGGITMGRNPGYEGAKFTGSYLEVGSTYDELSDYCPYFSFNQSIDITNFNTLRVTAYSRYTNCHNIYVYANNSLVSNGNGFTSAPPAGPSMNITNITGTYPVYNLDISSLTGNKYFGIYLNPGGVMKITKMELLP